MVPKSKNILTILVFFLSPMHLLSYPIDRSRSQLSISFFLASLRFLQRPKRPLLFCQNFEPAGKKILKRGKKILKCLWLNFEFCGKKIHEFGKKILEVEKKFNYATGSQLPWQQLQLLYCRASVRTSYSMDHQDCPCQPRPG